MMILLGLILGVIQSVRLIFARADLRDLVGQIRLRKNRPDAILRFANARTREGRAIQNLIRTGNEMSRREASIPYGSARMLNLPVLGSSLAWEEVMQIVLNFLANRFLADSAAVISLDLSRQMQVLQLDRGRLQGPGLRAMIMSRFQQYFVLGRRDRLGAIDHTLERGLTGNLLFFGFAGSYAGEILTERPLVVWLGFTSPTRLSAYDSFCDVLKGIEGQLRDYERTKHLQESYLFEQRRSEERAQLLAYAAHDMRAPIGNMRLSLALLQNSDLAEEAQGFVSQLQTSCELLSDIVDDAHDYSQLRAGLLRAEKRDISCAELVERICQAFGTSARAKKLALISSAPAGLLIRADLKQITRILANIVGNAIKYTERGFISITCSAVEGDRIAIAIRDSGIGMNDDQISRVFEPYTRFAGGHTEGDGLGLALTRAFAELNECELAVCSAPQQGTTITLCVPAGESAPLQLQALDEEQAGMVLISDDHIEASVSLSRILEMNGYDVQVAVSIADSRSAICSLRPKYLITDLSFTDGDGESLIRFVRNNLEDCEIIVVSGRELHAAHRDLLESAKITFLRKPLDVPVLLSYLKELRAVPQPAARSGPDRVNSRRVA